MHTFALVLQHMDEWWGGWWPGVVTMVVSALVLAAVVLLVVRLVFIPVVEGTEPTREDDDTDDALAILRERYARGDLTEEEFRERRAVLREKRE